MSETHSLQSPGQIAGLTRSADTEAMKPPDLVGHALFERIGVGGMGEVYRCGDALQRDLAIKVLLAELQSNADFEERFLREARLTGSLQHPCIVPVHQLGRLADGRPCYTMKLVRGRTLADLLREEPAGPERLPRLLAVVEKVCQAMAFAHSKGVIHRDLKPSNVMVGEFGEVQVMDWGLAKELSRAEPAAPPVELTEDVETLARVGETAGLSRAGAALGTPSYMPPEQAAGDWDIVDERADVFSLGAMLCEALTGRPPYHGANRDDLLRRARRGDLAEALGRLEKCGTDETLIALCRDCLAPERTDRPRDAEQVAQRVAKYQAAVQERLRQADLMAARAAVKAQEERKRRRWAIAFVFLLLAGTALSIWLAVRATDAEKKATEQRDQAEKARKDTAEERDRAVKAETDTKAVLGFYQDKVLSAGRPKDQEGGLGNQVTLQQAVDAAESAIAKAFVDRPLVEASIRETLGTTYWYLGDYTPAIQQQERALALRQAKLGPDHADTLHSCNELANAYWSAGRIADAIRLHERTLKQYEAQLGPDHPDTLSCRNNLADAYLDTGRNAEAILLHEHNLKLYEAKLGPDHPETFTARNNLAVAYWSVGRITEAIPLFEQTLKEREAQLGPDHPYTLSSSNNLAEAYKAAGRTEEAIHLHEQALKQMEAQLGAAHPETLKSRDNLATAYLAAGRTEEAIRLHEQTLKQFEVKLGPNHPDTLGTRNNLAHAYERAGTFSKAESLYRVVLEQKRKSFGTEHPITARQTVFLGSNLLHQHKYVEAEPLLRDGLKVLEAKEPDAWATFDAQAMLGGALLGQKKYADAEPQLLQGCQGMIQREMKIPAYDKKRLIEALELLVRLYEATNQPDKTGSWRKQLETIKCSNKAAKK
jgi:tetratricopeptide (TPR) repeat protein